MSIDDANLVKSDDMRDPGNVVAKAKACHGAGGGGGGLQVAQESMVKG